MLIEMVIVTMYGILFYINITKNDLKLNYFNSDWDMAAVDSIL